jgi:hypothetical protein
MKQYRGGPSGGNNSTQNQNTFLNADELSKPNKKYSIATIVVAAPRTQINRGSFKIGTRVSGIPPVARTHIKNKKSVKDRLAAMR